MNARKLALLILGLSCLSLLCAAPSHAAQKRKRGKQASSKAAAPVGGTRGKVLATIDAFEKAYQRKDKNTMLLKLMYPTTDKNLLNKRYQWLRGYGVDEVPAANRPPILFITAAGSYVPKTYKVISANPTSSANWTAVVEETGSCQEEGKRFSVKRRRTVTLAGMNGKWYIDNYFNPENPDEYGFWVDDITDEMKQTH